MSEKACPPSGALLAALAMARTLALELERFAISRTALPCDRVSEIFDCIFPVVAERPRHWDRLSRQDQAQLIEARRLMLAAIGRLRYLPSIAAPIERRLDRPTKALKPAPPEPPKPKPTSVVERPSASIAGLTRW